VVDDTGWDREDLACSGNYMGDFIGQWSEGTISGIDQHDNYCYLFL